MLIYKQARVRIYTMNKIYIVIVLIMVMGLQNCFAIRDVVKFKNERTSKNYASFFQCFLAILMLK